MIHLLKLIAGLVLATVAGCAPMHAGGSTASTMTGTWEEQVFRDGRDVPFSVLTVELRISGNAVSGRYCFVTQFGNRIDCDPDQGDNLRGHLTGAGIANIRFTSSFGDQEGTATLSLDGHTLSWKTTAPPSHDRFLGPYNARLRRAEP